jgi:tripartite-type tricarboxylate transporter receptor subunit TctC
MGHFASIALPLLCAVMSLHFPAAQADEFPQRSISFVVPWGPGGPADLLARGLIDQGGALLKQPIVVLNRPGASGTIGSAEVFRAKADGYTILLADNISTVFQPRRLALPYRGFQDFQAVIKLSDVPNVLVVSASSKWKTLDEFVADARAKPGSLRVTTAGPFTGTDLNVREFNHIAKVDIQTIPSTGGTAQALTLMLGGHVEGAVAAPASIVEHVNAGTLRPLAVFAKQRIGRLPDVPTTVELGYPTTMTSMFYVSAPRDVDAEALRKLHGAFREVVTSQKWKEMSTKFGLLPEPLGPKELTSALEQWDKYFATLTRDLNIQQEK